MEHPSKTWVKLNCLCRVADCVFVVTLGVMGVGAKAPRLSVTGVKPDTLCNILDRLPPPGLDNALTARSNVDEIELAAPPQPASGKDR